MKVEQLRAALRGVSAYKDLMRQPLMVRVIELLDDLCAGAGERAMDAYTDVFYALRQSGHEGLGSWLKEHLTYDEAPYPKLAERGDRDPALESAARRDVETLGLLAVQDCDSYVERLAALMGEECRPVVSNLPRWKAEAPFSFDSLTDSYRANGAGLFARWRAFVWENGALIPVADPDLGAEGEMMGYESQRSEVVANTRALAAGRAVNNVLLYGDSGTGKSATVKSLLTVPGLEDLRLIEADKENLCDLPVLIRMLGGRRQKFVIFIDDLAFDRDDRTYSVLKTILEGGVERRPDNVVIYATSNRRHLVRQNFSDRTGDEVDIQETIDEKTSLSERFGIRIVYQALDKAKFLDLVDRMADQDGVTLDRDTLHARALTWERYHPGRTPRTARQFLNSLRAE